MDFEAKTVHRLTQTFLPNFSALCAKSLQNTMGRHTNFFPYSYRRYSLYLVMNLTNKQIGVHQIPRSFQDTHNCLRTTGLECVILYFWLKNQTLIIVSDTENICCSMHIRGCSVLYYGLKFCPWILLHILKSV